MNRSTQTDNINCLIERECRKYFFSQKENILSNLRTYARYDDEINFFLDKVLDELRNEFKKEKKFIKDDLNVEFTKWKVQYKETLHSGINKLEHSLDNKTKEIFKKEPYDMLTKRFMLNLKNECKNEYDDKINNVYLLIFLYLLVKLDFTIIYINRL